MKIDRYRLPESTQSLLAASSGTARSPSPRTGTGDGLIVHASNWLRGTTEIWRSPCSRGSLSLSQVQDG